MISYERDRKSGITESSVKIIGLGGAGSNMLDHVALNELRGTELLCINTDMRVLNSSFVHEKIQLGKGLTKGLGAGGDPEIGLNAAHEAEQEIRDALRDEKMVFLCVGLGGGTGSGAAPFICRIAREEGVFVVVFASIPFGFEGARRRSQADAALNELSVLANALMIFDNDRMGELLVEDKGIHAAFTAADEMISESVKAITRLVLRPGLIRVGLDDLVSALRATSSRCLFGSGMASGENRTDSALKKALASPLMGQGRLLHSASTVLVHVCGGESLSLAEVDSLLTEVSKHLAEDTHILFGAATDSDLEDQLCISIISALPETEILRAHKNEILAQDDTEEPTKPSSSTTAPLVDDSEASAPSTPPSSQPSSIPTPAESGSGSIDDILNIVDPLGEWSIYEADDDSQDETDGDSKPETSSDSSEENKESEPSGMLNEVEVTEVIEPEVESKSETDSTPSQEADECAESDRSEKIVIEPVVEEEPPPVEEAPVKEEPTIPNPILKPNLVNIEPSEESEPEEGENSDEPEGKSEEEPPIRSEVAQQERLPETVSPATENREAESRFAPPEEDPQASSATSEEEIDETSQAELELDGGPKGRFDGAAPNIHEGQDLDIPPYLRNKSR